MNWKDLQVKVCDFLHLRRNCDFSNMDITDYGWVTVDENLTEKDSEAEPVDNPTYALGASARTQMLSLSKTLVDFKDSIVDSLPDYLSDNLESVDVDTSYLYNVCLKFHFTNYNKMNRRLVNEIRSDFRECMGLNKLPGYKVKFNDDNFILYVLVVDYL